MNIIVNELVYQMDFSIHTDTHTHTMHANPILPSKRDNCEKSFVGFIKWSSRRVDLIKFFIKDLYISEIKHLILKLKIENYVLCKCTAYKMFGIKLNIQRNVWMRLFSFIHLFVRIDIPDSVCMVRR